MSSRKMEAILSSAFLRVRTFPAVMTVPSRTLSTGVSWMRLPISAAAAPIRPPFCRNVSDSGVNRKRVRPTACAATFAHSSRSAPTARAAAASRMGQASS